MIDDLIAWLKLCPAIAAYEYWPGMWEDNASNKERHLCALRVSPGSNVGRYRQWQNVRVVLLSPVNGMARRREMESAAQALVLHAQQFPQTCEIGDIRAIGGIMGPGRTENKRVWFEVNLTILV